MDFLGIIAFVMGLGWIPILIIIAPVIELIRRIKRGKKDE